MHSECGNETHKCTKLPDVSFGLTRKMKYTFRYLCYRYKELQTAPREID